MQLFYSLIEGIRMLKMYNANVLKANYIEHLSIVYIEAFR